MRNRFEQSQAIDQDLRDLEFSENRADQEAIALRVLEKKHEIGLSDQQEAVFNFLLAEIRQKLDQVVDLQTLKNERKFWLRPPWMNGI